MRIKHDLIKKLRLERGWRQLDVANELQIDERTYRRYESGEVNSMRPDTSFTKQYEILRDLAALYNLDAPEVLLEPSDAPSPLPSPAAVCETPGGSTGSPPGSSYSADWYVPREMEERRALKRLRHAGAPVVLQGPALFGKSAMLRFLLAKEELVELAQAVRFVKLPPHNSQRIASLDALLKQIGYDLLAKHGPDEANARLDTYWQGPGSSITRLTRLVESEVLSSRITLIVIDRADEIQTYDFHNDFFAMLRAWSERRSEHPWTRLRLALTISTEPTFLESIDHSSFFALATPIRLDDFKPAQVEMLAARLGLPMAASQAEQLLELVGGNPYLLHLALYEARLQEMDVIKMLGSSVDGHGLFAQHLMRLRSWLSSAKLTEVMSNLLAGQSSSISFPDYCRLYSKGLIRESATGIYSLRSRIYEQYFASVCKNGAWAA